MDADHPLNRVLVPRRSTHAGEHLAVALAAAAPDDGAQRRVGLHRRGVDADALALHQATLGQTLQHPGEDCVVQLERQARARAAQPGMVRYPLALTEAEELAQRQAIQLGNWTLQVAMQAVVP